MVRLSGKLKIATKRAMTKSSHDASTEACVLRFVNKSARSINALWMDFTGEEKAYHDLEPGHARPQRELTAVELFVGDLQGRRV